MMVRCVVVQEAELCLHAKAVPLGGLQGLPPGLLPGAPIHLRSCFAFKEALRAEDASRNLAALEIIAGASEEGLGWKTSQGLQYPEMNICDGKMFWAGLAL